MRGFEAALRAIAFASLAAAFAGCGGGSGGNAPAPAPTPVAGRTLVYVAIGASDAVGVGASVSCAAPGASIAAPTCPGGTGYVPDLANSLAQSGVKVQLDDLGISGAVIGPDLEKTANAYGLAGGTDACTARDASDAVTANFLENELPFVPSDANLVTIFAGGNDTLGVVNALGCGAGGTTVTTEQAYLDAQAAAYAADLRTLIAGVRARAPAAKIVLANLPNIALVPLGQAQSATVQAGLAAFSVGIDGAPIAAATAAGIPVVDLLCNSQSYESGNFSSDGFHPNDAGYADFAASFFIAVAATAPATPAPTCKYAVLASVLRRPVANDLRFRR